MTRRLAARGLGEQIVVVREERPSEERGAIQQRRVRERVRAILEGRQYVDLPQPQPGRDRPRHVLIHVERDAHSAAARRA